LILPFNFLREIIEEPGRDYSAFQSLFEFWGARPQLCNLFPHPYITGPPLELLFPYGGLHPFVIDCFFPLCKPRDAFQVLSDAPLFYKFSFLFRHFITGPTDWSRSPYLFLPTVISSTSDTLLALACLLSGLKLHGTNQWISDPFLWSFPIFLINTHLPLTQADRPFVWSQFWGCCYCPQFQLFVFAPQLLILSNPTQPFP